MPAELVVGVPSEDLPADPRLVRAQRPKFVHGDRYLERIVELERGRTRVSLAPDSIALCDAASGALVRLLRFDGGVPVDPTLGDGGGMYKTAAIGCRGYVFGVGGDRAWLWHPGTEALVPLGPASHPKAVALSPSGRRFAVLGDRVGAWSVEAGPPLEIVARDIDYSGYSSASAFAFNPAGTSLSVDTYMSAQSGSDYEESVVLDLPGLAPEPPEPSSERRCSLEASAPRSIAVSADGKWLATSGGWGRADGDAWTAWGPTACGLHLFGTVGFEGETVYRVSYGEVDAVNVSTGARAPAAKLPDRPWVDHDFVAFAPGNGVLASLDLGLTSVNLGCVGVYLGRVGGAARPLDNQRLPCQCLALAVAGDGATVFLVGKTDRVLWWRSGSAPVPTHSPALTGLGEGARRSAALSLDGTTAAVAGATGFAAFRASGVALRYEAAPPFHGTRALAVSADGALLAVSMADWSIAVFRTDPWWCAATLRGHYGAATALCFHGPHLFSAGADHAVCTWRVGDLF